VCVPSFILWHGALSLVSSRLTVAFSRCVCFRIQFRVFFFFCSCEEEEETALRFPRRVPTLRCWAARPEEARSGSALYPGDRDGSVDKAAARRGEGPGGTAIRGRRRGARAARIGCDKRIPSPRARDRTLGQHRPTDVSCLVRSGPRVGPPSPSSPRQRRRLVVPAGDAAASRSCPCPHGPVGPRALARSGEGYCYSTCLIARRPGPAPAMPSVPGSVSRVLRRGRGTRPFPRLQGCVWRARWGGVRNRRPNHGSGASGFLLTRTRGGRGYLSAPSGSIRGEEARSAAAAQRWNDDARHARRRTRAPAGNGRRPCCAAVLRTYGGTNRMCSPGCANGVRACRAFEIPVRKPRQSTRADRRTNPPHPRTAYVRRNETCRHPEVRTTTLEPFLFIRFNKSRCSVGPGDDDKKEERGRGKHRSGSPINFNVPVFAGS
jgi:hypothetical protein